MTEDPYVSKAQSELVMAANNVAAGRPIDPKLETRLKMAWESLSIADALPPQFKDKTFEQIFRPADPVSKDDIFAQPMKDAVSALDLDAAPVLETNMFDTMEPFPDAPPGPDDFQPDSFRQTSDNVGSDPDADPELVAPNFEDPAEIEQLERELAEARSRITELEEQLRESEANLNEAAQELESLQSGKTLSGEQLTEKQRLIGELENGNKELRTKVSEKQMEIRDLNTQLEAEKSRVTSLKHELRRAHDQLTGKDESITLLQNERDGLVSELVDAHNRVDELVTRFSNPQKPPKEGPVMNQLTLPEDPAQRFRTLKRETKKARYEITAEKKKPLLPFWAIIIGFPILFPLIPKKGMANTSVLTFCKWVMLIALNLAFNLIGAYGITNAVHDFAPRTWNAQSVTGPVLNWTAETVKTLTGVSTDSTLPPDVQSRLEAANRAIEDWRQLVSDHTRTLDETENLRVQLDSKVVEIDRITRLKDRETAERERLTQTLQNQNTQLEELQSQVSRNTVTIQARDAEIARQSGQIEALRERCAGSDRRIEELRAELQTKEEERRAVSEMCQTLQRRINEYEALLAPVPVLQLANGRISFPSGWAPQGAQRWCLEGGQSVERDVLLEATPGIMVIHFYGNGHLGSHRVWVKE